MSNELSGKYKGLERFILFVLPLVYITLAFIFLKDIGGFYMLGFDPVYAYLLNGTNLASGFLDVGHIDHPGTPVQCFAALVIFIKHLLTGTGSLYQDVLSNPESYLYTCSVSLIFLLASVTFFTGRYVYRNTNSIFTAFIFQLGPIINAGGIFDASMLRPESLIIITATFFSAYLYVNVLNQIKSGSTEWSNRKVITMAVVCALLIACKITYVPFVIPVLFLFKQRKASIYFSLYSLLFCFYYTGASAFEQYVQLDN